MNCFFLILISAKREIDFLKPGINQEFTFKDQAGCDDILDSDVDEDGLTSVFYLEPGQIIQNINAGIRQYERKSTESGLEVIKSSSTFSYSTIGDEIIYTIEVTNIGEVFVDDIVVNDPLIEIGALACEYNSLQPRESMICTATYFVNQLDLEVGAVKNIATASGVDSDGHTVSEISNEVKVTGNTCSVSNECVGISFASSTDQENGKTTLCFDIKVNCGKDLNRIVFDINNGILLPLNNEIMTSEAGIIYQVKNPANHPIQGDLQFETIGKGIKRGEIDQFCFEVPTNVAEGLYTMLLIAEVGNTNYELNLDLEECLQQDSLFSSADKEKQFPLAVGVFPNPATDEINLDVSNFKDRQVNISLWNYIGQMEKNWHIDLYGKELVSIPVQQFPSGLYTLIISSIDEQPIVKKLIIVR